MTKEEASTRDKIMAIAHKLFAQKGLAAVSVREIAKLAAVNIAAINYHFGNKEALYEQTIRASLQKTALDIKKLYEDAGPSTSLEEIVVLVFKYFKNHQEELLTGFKLFLNSGKVSEEFNEEDCLIGPPGGNVLYQCFKKTVPNALDADIIWAVRILFNQIIHKSLLVCTHSENLQKRFNLSSQDLEKDILRLVKVLVQELKQSV
jgi:AcrR family transcriptional regulator